MKEYKKLIQAISKRVKTVDKVLAASRKHLNEFVSIELCAIDDKGGFFYGRDPLITVTELWHKPHVSYCRETNSTIIRPDYMWEHTEEFWEYKPWTLDFYKTDLKDGKHRPLFIYHGVGETRADYTFIYTKKEFDRAQGVYKFPIALKQLELGTKRVDGGKHEGMIDVPRILGDEIDTMKDDDVMFITGWGWDQNSIFEIKHFVIRDMDLAQREEWDSNESCAQNIVNTLIDLDKYNTALTRSY
jgi:hypothetical protein